MISASRRYRQPAAGVPGPHHRVPVLRARKGVSLIAFGVNETLRNLGPSDRVLAFELDTSRKDQVRVKNAGRYQNGVLVQPLPDPQFRFHAAAKGSMVARELVDARQGRIRADRYQRTTGGRQSTARVP